MKHATVAAFLPNNQKQRIGHGTATSDKEAIDKAFDDLLRQVPKERLKTYEVTITVSTVKDSGTTGPFPKVQHQLRRRA